MNLKTAIFSLFITLTFFSTAQTREIEFKSHSGKHGHFNGTGDGDLGLRDPDPVLIKMKKVNDTTFVGTYSQYGGKIDKKTYNDEFWMKPKAELDSLVAIYFPEVILVGFEAKSGAPIAPVKSKGKKMQNLHNKSSFVPFGILSNEPFNGLTLMALSLISLFLLSRIRTNQRTVQTIS